ncbi:MAG: penicillin-insensitive murein endopeptidase [Sandaracinaceae bacterium]|nr:penicillin-insensitive murein endopeptidase [Sandaracinaceae bacterium]
MPSRPSKRLLLSCLLAIALLPTWAHADRPLLYAVRPGDALSLIAERFGITVAELRTWNGIEGDRILVGQELRLAPEGATPPTAPSAESTTPPSSEAATATESPAPAPSPAAEPVVAAPERSRAARPQPNGVSYQVRPGDTLSGIAVRLGVEVSVLLEHNDGLDPNRIRAGQRIFVPEARPAVDLEVQRGDSLARIAARHEVSVAEILRWNPAVRRHGLRAGRTIRLYTNVPLSRSESVGLPYNGSLINPEPLPDHPLYVVREASRAFGTLETVRWIRDAFEVVRRQHPAGPRVRIHDLSDSDGGALRDHRSHQSGRDADIAFFRRHCAQNECGFGNTTPAQLDVRRQWALFHAWLVSGRVEAIFIDYSLQQPLYEYARSQGATPAQLRDWFQYPRGQNHAFGIIRHFPHHRDHLHVRFVCPDTDRECRAGWRFAHAH